MLFLFRTFFTKVIFTSLLLVPLILKSQIQDDFSDGDLTANPVWQGDVSNFIVNAALELQLNAPDAGTSFLFVPAEIADSNVWELLFRLEFDPSNSNKLRIYLQSDSADFLSGNGYFLAIGKDGSEDAIELYRQDLGIATLLGSATVGTVATSPNVRIKMTRQTDGQWSLAADYEGGWNFSPEFTVQDATYGTGSNFFGFHCTYTATRKDKFFFDNILVAPLLPDTEPPILVSATPLSGTEVDVVFSEPLDEASATEPSNFNIDNSIGEPAAAFLDGVDKTVVHLSLANPLSNLTTYALTAAGLTDLNGNVSSIQAVSFTYVEIEEANEFDILINEIMSDPTPKVGLPDVEFIELYNRSGKVIDLEGFRFSSGSTPQVFPSYQLLPGSHVIVCDDSNVDSLANFGNVAALSSFPSLTNDGDDLTLTDPSGNVIHHVSYTLAWYKDSQKDDGGWTLELVNPLAACRGENNWRASASLLGGTPGQPNSVLDPAADETGPELIRVFASPDSPMEILLFFNEGLEKASAEEAINYSVTNGMNVVSATLIPPANDAVLLQLTQPLQPSIIYEVTVSNAVRDCSGNPFDASDKLTFALPEPIEPLDLVINEILFNPATGGSDFLEIYNRSDKILNLGDLIIGNLLIGEDTTVVDIETDRLIFPGEYAVFSENPGDILSRFTVLNPETLIKNDLPSFNDEKGNVTIYRADVNGAVIIDAFDYSEDFHHPLLEDKNGISLERLNHDGATQNSANWHSAAATAGFATPTFKNSQFFGNMPSAADFFDIPEKKFSPDGDGYQDFLLVNYQMDKPGYSATVKVFDAEGRLVKKVANNELLASDGFMIWNGDTDDGEKARLGIYIVYIQLFHPDGPSREFKKPCVVATKF